MTTTQKPLQICDAPGDMNTGLKLTPTPRALGTLANVVQLLASAHELDNAVTMLKRYDGTNQLWGALDFAWWCFFTNWTESNVTEFFVETEHMLDFDDDEDDYDEEDYEDYDEDEEDELPTGD